MLFKSTQLRRALDKLQKLYIEKQQADYLVIPYVLTCAAYLEAKLNDSLLEANKQYGEEFALAIMSLSLPNKLRAFVPVLTKGEYDINKEHFIFHRLNSLIRVRNSIAHAKSEMEIASASPEDLVEVPILNAGMIKVPKRFMSRLDVTLGASDAFSPLEYNEALDKLEQWFFHRYPDKLKKVAMVVRRSGRGEWKEQCKTWIKHLD